MKFAHLVVVRDMDSDSTQLAQSPLIFTYLWLGDLVCVDSAVMIIMPLSLPSSPVSPISKLLIPSFPQLMII